MTEEFRVGLEAAGTTVASPDGTDLQLTDSALAGKSGAKLAEEILKLARKAKRGAAVNVAAAFAPLGGDSEAMHMVTGYVPPEEPEEPPAPEPVRERRLWQHDEQETPPSPPVRRPARPPRDDDDDFGDNTFMRRD